MRDSSDHHNVDESLFFLKREQEIHEQEDHFLITRLKLKYKGEVDALHDEWTWKALRDKKSLEVSRTQEIFHEQEIDRQRFLVVNKNHI